MADEEFIHSQTYFLDGDGYGGKLTRLCDFLIESEIDCRIDISKPDMKRYGRDVTFRFKEESDLVAFKLRFDATII